MRVIRKRSELLESAISEELPSEPTTDSDPNIQAAEIDNQLDKVAKETTAGSSPRVIIEAANEKIGAGAGRIGAIGRKVIGNITPSGGSLQSNPGSVPAPKPDFAGHLEMNQRQEEINRLQGNDTDGNTEVIERAAAGDDIPFKDENAGILHEGNLPEESNSENAGIFDNVDTDLLEEGTERTLNNPDEDLDLSTITEADEELGDDETTDKIFHSIDPLEQRGENVFDENEEEETEDLLSVGRIENQARQDAPQTDVPVTSLVDNLKDVGSKLGNKISGDNLPPEHPAAPVDSHPLVTAAQDAAEIAQTAVQGVQLAKSPDEANAAVALAEKAANDATVAAAEAKEKAEAATPNEAVKANEVAEAAEAAAIVARTAYQAANEAALAMTKASQQPEEQAGFRSIDEAKIDLQTEGGNNGPND